MYLRPVPQDSPDKQLIHAINEEAFPEWERCSVDSLYASGADGNLDMLGIYDEDELAGFLAVRKFEDIRYLAYFAVESSRRSHGTGSTALQLLSRYYSGCQIVTEFETPDGSSAIKQRRRDFYLRSGFRETGWYSFYDETEFTVACSGSGFDKACFDRFVTYLGTIVPDFIPKLYRKQQENKLYYMFNKPQGCVTARSDAVHKTVMDYFPADIAKKLHPVGRLDKDTCGLLVLTNDGDLDFRIMQPDRHISKTYFFYALGEMTAEKVKRLENGIQMADFTTRRAVFRFVREYRIRELESFMSARRRDRYMKNPDGPAFSGEITICEGKKHEVKRMLEAVNCRIIFLRRDSIGALTLDPNLSPGEYRPLTEKELSLLKTET